MTQTPPLTRVVGDEDRSAGWFTRVFLATLLAGIAASVAAAWLIDPMHTFGTGRIGSFVTEEFDLKPEAFLQLEPPAQLVILGTSRVMKIRPECVTELTGYPAFNFGLNSSRAEDWAAAYRFARARSKVPLRELVIGVDVEGFDNHAETEPRLLSSRYLRDYLGDSWHMSWGVATRALFGWQAFKYAALLSWYELHPSSRPQPKMRFDARGFVTYDAVESAERAGTLDRARAYAFSAEKLRGIWAGRGFDALSAERVALFKDMVRTAHADGITVNVFMPPLHDQLAALRTGPMAVRVQECEAMLRDLAREGTIRWFPFHRSEDFHGDPDGYIDGLHMTESNTTRMLLAMFDRPHGCGL